MRRGRREGQRGGRRGKERGGRQETEDDSKESSNQHPGMHSLPFILVFLLLLLLLLLNEHGNGLLLLLRQLLVQSIELVALHHKRAVEHRALLHSVDRLLLDVTIDHFELCFLSPRAALRGSAPTMRHHRLDRLVRQADPLLGIAYDDVGVVSYTNKQACQHNAHIETIPCLRVDLSRPARCRYRTTSTCQFKTLVGEGMYLGRIRGSHRCCLLARVRR
eukprot:758671-Hanusia_phi.AAC.2